jgi:hypothetical protein
MNSFRIGVIGIPVEYGGTGMAEGFLHDFEGWIVFMACAGILGLEMWILSRVGKDRMPLREAFAIEGPQPLPPEAETPLPPDSQLLLHGRCAAPFRGGTLATPAESRRSRPRTMTIRPICA